MDADGNAMAVWEQWDGPDQMIVASRFTPSGGWGPTNRIDAGDAHGVPSALHVAMDPNGSAIAVWQGDDGEDGTIFANHFTPSQGWGEAANIDDQAPGYAEGPRVAMDGNGNGIAVWRQDHVGETWDSRIWANRFAPTGGWEAAEPIEDGDPSHSWLPDISANDAGVFVAVWERQKVEEGGGVWAIRYAPEDGWGTEEHVEAEHFGYAMFTPRVAVDPEGNALAVWQGAYRGNGSIWASHYTVEKQWDRSVRLDYGSGAYFPPQVGIDASGRGLAIWTQSDYSTGSGVWTNRYADAPVEDHSAYQRRLCDAVCQRTSECPNGDGTVPECVSECMDELQRMPCVPNQGAMDQCLDELPTFSCEDLELGRLPYACEHVCLGDFLCESRTCDDWNDCTDDSCDPTDGSCINAPLADGASCADGAGTCKSGLCSAEFACTEEGIREAVELGGGPHTFACNGPTRVETESEISIRKDVILDGEGNLTVDAGGRHRVFSVSTEKTELRQMTITGGNQSGIHNNFFSGLTLFESTVSGNTATNDGGGIFNTGTLTLIRSTISENTAGFRGGGIYNYGEWSLSQEGVTTLTLINSTVSNNSGDFGGGIFSEFALVHVISSTLAGNDGFDIVRMFEEGEVAIKNSLIEGTCEGGIASGGGNLESPGDTCRFSDPTDQTDVSSALLDLSPLQDNGGPTLTHLPGSGSAAIDIIDPEDCVDADGLPLMTDQRGETRPQGPKCDVGAVEAVSGAM